MKKGHKYISSLLFGFYFLLFLAGCGGRGTETDLSIKAENDQDTNINAIKPHIDFTEIPLFFIANTGQVNDKAKFYAKGSKYTLWLTNEGMLFDTVQRSKKAGPGRAEEEGEQIHRHVSSLVFVNANPEPKIIPVEQTPLKVNYFIGNDRSKWHSDIPTSQAVLYKDLYQDINLKVYGIERQIEYDWIVKPGGDPDAIRFAYKTVKGSRIDDEGNLLIETDSGELMHKRPVAYQEIDDKRVIVTAEYNKTGENSYGFAVDNYHEDYPLVIDPVVLVYSTYLGGSNWDKSYAIAADDKGNVYATGFTLSSDFPIRNQYQPYEWLGFYNFVTKINTTRSGTASLIYSTYFGSINPDSASYGIAADDNGNVYVTGSSGGIPTKNQYQTCLDSNVFVARIDTTLSGEESLVYSTYLGTAELDEDGGVRNAGSNGIAADNSGNVYVTGWTGSADFPIKNQYQTCQDGGVFVTKIDTTQSGEASLIYSTCLGGSGSEGGRGIAADNNGTVYVTGSTSSTDFPIKNQFQTHQGDDDAFVAKIDTTRSGIASFIYSTYLGGESDDYGTGIAADNSGNVYVTGWTRSTDFPIKNQYQANQSGVDAFVTKIDTTRSGSVGLIYSTYLGGTTHYLGLAHDYGTGIAADDSGNAYVTGRTQSVDFPTKNQFQTHQGDDDAFVAKIDTTRSDTVSLIYSTYLGGAVLDQGLGIAVGNSGDVYVTGWTKSTDFPTKNQYQKNQNDHDAFITKLSFSNPGPFDLSVILAGPAEGTVTSDPAGIDCPGNCTEEYEKNTSVTLTAIPSQGAHFGSWSGGGCSGSDSCTVTMDDDHEITATFRKKGALPWLMLFLK